MREILFRGKRIDNGEWVEGDFVRLKDGNRIMHCIYGFGEIKPETLGQYTGLTDKNGKKIFEGDIVRYYEENCKVIFEQRNNCAYFGISMRGIVTIPFNNAIRNTDIEVIGNIHDGGFEVDKNSEEN